MLGGTATSKGNSLSTVSEDGVEDGEVVGVGWWLTVTSDGPLSLKGKRR